MGEQPNRNGTIITKDVAKELIDELEIEIKNNELVIKDSEITKRDDQLNLLKEQ